MNKGTAIVGFFLCFLAGIGLMYGVDRSHGVNVEPEGIAAKGGLDHSAAPVPVTGKDPFWGRPDAPVTVVEVSDFECPFCSRVEPTMDQIRKNYGPEKVRIVWKHNPLPFHKEARPAAEAAATVFTLGGNDAFWKFHDTVFQNQRTLSEDNFEKWAVALRAAKVDEDLAMAKSIGVTGTPAFRINGITLVGAQPYEKFKEIIDQELVEANKLIASGTAKTQVYVERAKKNVSSTPPPKEEQAQKPAEDTAIWKVPVLDDDPIQGPKDALVTIVEFSDFQCPFCKRVEDTIKQVHDKYGNDVRFVWKTSPCLSIPALSPPVLWPVSPTSKRATRHSGMHTMRSSTASPSSRIQILRRWLRNSA